jgi:hypothetical protein
MLGKKEKESLNAFNRKGKRTNIPTVIWNSINSLQHSFFIDGELIGETFHVFDILEHQGECLRKKSFIERMKHLKALLHKNLIYWKRDFVVSAFELVIPCILLVIMILIR